MASYANSRRDGANGPFYCASRVAHDETKTTRNRKKAPATR